MKLHISAIQFLAAILGVLGEDYEKCTSSDCSGKAFCATIYQHRNFGGWYQCISSSSISDCVNLNQWWTYSGARVSGVDPRGNCVRLYDRYNCQGTFIDITSSNGYLNQVDFEDMTYSMSSCDRDLDYGECSVKSLFSKTIEDKQVTKASTDVLAIYDQLASLAISGFATVIPGLDLFYSGIKFITGLFDKEKSMEALIDAKIEDALAGNAASQISAKIYVINSALKRVMSKDTPSADRRIDLGLAIHSCHEVKRLFEDTHYSFVKNKIVSSPFLVSFSTVYLSVAKLAYELRPEMRYELQQHMRELVTLNELFLTEAKRQRKEKLVWDDFPKTTLVKSFYVVEDRLVCDPWEDRPADYRNRRPSCEFSKCLRSQQSKCSRCLGYYQKTIDSKIDKFFQPVIAKLRQFP